MVVPPQGTLAPGTVIGPEQLTICRGLLAGAGVTQAAAPLLNGDPLGLEDENMSLSDAERDLVVKVLGKTDWNISKSARIPAACQRRSRCRVRRASPTGRWCWRRWRARRDLAR